MLKNKLTQIIVWLAPTAMEVVVYVSLVFITILISNVGQVQKLLLLPANLNLRQSAINSIDSVLRQFLGERLAATLSTGIFWSFVGLVVYIIFWLVSNFSIEVSNDLAITKYIHPRNVNVYSPIRDFVSRTVFQLIVVGFLLFFVNFCWQVLLPLGVQSFRDVAQSWPNSDAIFRAFFAAVGELATFHILVVLSRLLLLRKRVFGKYQS